MKCSISSTTCRNTNDGFVRSIGVTESPDCGTLANDEGGPTQRRPQKRTGIVERDPGSIAYLLEQMLSDVRPSRRLEPGGGPAAAREAPRTYSDLLPRVLGLGGGAVADLQM